MAFSLPSVRSRGVSDGDRYLVPARRLMHARFPQLDEGSARRFMVTAVALCVIGPLFALAVVVGVVAPEWSTFMLLAGFVVGAVAGSLVVPFVATGATRWYAGHRRLSAGIRLRRLAHAAHAGDPEAVGVLRACAAYLASVELDHVELDASWVNDAVGALDDLGAVAGLAWGVLVDPNAVRADDAAEVLRVADIADSDPAFRLLVDRVAAPDGAYQRALRVAASCERANMHQGGRELLLTLATEWDGDLDDLDAVVELLAVPS